MQGCSSVLPSFLNLLLNLSANSGPAVPIYTIIVQCSGVPFYQTSDDVSGWVMVRSLNEFQQLHSSIKEVSGFCEYFLSF